MGLKPNLSISMPSLSVQNERSVSSLEKEIMRLQEVLKEREAEISVLEVSLKEVQQEKSLSTPIIEVQEAGASVNVAESTLSPKTLNRFDHIRKTMENANVTGSTENGSSYSDGDSLERLNELMLYVAHLGIMVITYSCCVSPSSMAQKESLHKETVEALNTQLSQTRRQLEDLTNLSRDQVFFFFNLMTYNSTFLRTPFRPSTCQQR